MTLSNRTVRIIGIIVVVLIAAYAIAWISAVRRTGKYLADLSSQEPDKVMDAMGALRERGKAVVPKLQELVRTGQGEGAARAAWLLGMIGDPHAASDLVAALQSKDPEVRLGALQGLGQLHYTGQNAAMVVQSVGAILTKADEKNEVRVAAAYALGSLGQRGGVTPLVTVLGDRPKPVPPTPAPPPAPVAPATPPAAGAKPPAPPAAPAAPPPPPDTTIPVRAAAARALGRIADPYAIDALVTAVSEAEPDPEVRVAAGYALGDVGAAAVVDEAAIRAVNGLIEGLKDKNADVRTACAYALGKTRLPKSMESTVAAAISKTKTDDDYWARLAAARSADMLRLPE